MAPAQFSGNPAQLRQRGVAITQVGSGLRADVIAAEAALPLPAGGNPGWSMMATAAATSTAWQRYLAALCDQVSGMGDAVVTAADGYARTDHRSAMELRHHLDPYR